MVTDSRLSDPGDFPSVVLLDTTNRCNLRCSFCGHRVMTRPQGKMAMPLFRKLIDEIAEKDCDTRVWMVFFGEALILRYQLFWQIHYAKYRGLHDVVLNTNGNLLDDDAAHALIESGLNAIYIGIDAACPDTYNRLRVGGDYNRVVSNVENLLDLKCKLGAAFPIVYVQFVVTDENHNEVEPFTRYWSARGATVKIRPKVTWAGAVEPYKVNALARFPCYWAMRTVNIGWDGRVVLCSVDYDARFVAGDVNRDTIQSVWLGALKGMRDAHVGEHYEKLPEFCQKCTDWQMARAEYRNND